MFHFSPNPYSAQRHIPNVALFPSGEENPVCRPRRKVRIMESDSDEDWLLISVNYTEVYNYKLTPDR